MIKVVEVSGARPNFMKIAPIHRLLVDSVGFDPDVHTGQHDDWEMSQIFLKDLGLEKADHDFEVGSRRRPPCSESRVSRCAVIRSDRSL